MPSAVSPSALQALDAVFHEEMAKLLQLSEILRREFDALSTQNGELVAAISQEKLAMLAELEGIAQHKSRLLESSGYSLTSNGLQSFLAAAAVPSLVTLWSEIESQLLACQKQNLVNGQLLEASRRQTQQLLALLVGESDSPAELYTAKGGTTLSQLSTQTRTKA